MFSFHSPNNGADKSEKSFAAIVVLMRLQTLPKTLIGYAVIGNEQIVKIDNKWKCALCASSIRDT